MAIGLKTHKLLWGASGNICAKCKRFVVEDATETDDPSLIGEEAHIVSRKKDGPRYDDPLPMDQRDFVANLVLLCNACHKIVDDQVGEYTVAALRDIKQKHETWVRETLGQGDQAKKRDDLIYADYVDTWARKADIDDWRDWSYGVLSHGRPQMSKARFDQLQELKTWIFGRVWPDRYPDIEIAFKNFRLVLEHLLNEFMLGADEVGGDTLMTRSYNPDEWLEQEVYDRGLARQEYHVYLVMDLMLELTRAANLICQRVRENLSASYRITEGHILAMGGPFENLADRTFVLTYSAAELALPMPYPGLQEFKKVRLTRDGYRFGIGEDNEQTE